MVAGTLHSWHVPTVPHACPTQLTQVMEAAGDPWQKAELVQETPGLQREVRLKGTERSSGHKRTVEHYRSKGHTHGLTMWGQHSALRLSMGHEILGQFKTQSSKMV